MTVKAEVVTRVSKKGTQYTAIEITIGTYKKLVFLNTAEMALLQLAK